MTSVEELYRVSLRLKLPRLVSLIEQEMQVSFETALRELYNSRLFQDLADEPTKIWHFSDYLLLDLFKQEKLTGKIDYPNVF